MHCFPLQAVNVIMTGRGSGGGNAGDDSCGGSSNGSRGGKTVTVILVVVVMLVLVSVLVVAELVVAILITGAFFFCRNQFQHLNVEASLNLQLSKVRQIKAALTAVPNKTFDNVF